MKRIVNPPAGPNVSSTAPTKIADPLISDISVDSLIADGLLALYREIKNLLILGSRGKLDPNSSRDLRDHLKLLFEIKDREKDFLKSISDEELQILLAKVTQNADNK